MQSAAYRPKRQIFSIVAIVTGALLALVVAFLTRTYLFAALIGIGFGVLIAPAMTLLQHRFKIPRGLSAFAMMLLILGGIAGISYGMFVLLSEQFQSLVSRAPQIADTARQQLDSIFGRVPWLEQQVRELNLGQAARSAATTFFQGVQASLAALVGFVLVVTIAIYVAINSREYFRGVLSLFPAYQRPKAAEVLRESATVLRKWFRSQLVVMLISGGLTTLALWILGIEYWLLLGVLTGVLGIIPYIGAFITVFATAAVTLGSEPEKIWWVLGLYLGIQQLEGDVTIPLVMRGGVHLPEVHMIVFMLVMGSLIGILGVFIAPPLLAVLRTVYLMTYVPVMNRKTQPE